MWLKKPTDNYKTCIQQEELSRRAFGMYGKVMALIHNSKLASHKPALAPVLSNQL